MLPKQSIHEENKAEEHVTTASQSWRLYSDTRRPTPDTYMSLTIMRRIKFCAGHRLHRHGGKCEYFHGHNYMADFYVSGDEVDDVGRVIDFAELKKLFKGWLDENWDHGFVLNQSDENGLSAVKIVEPCRYYVLPYNPTAENMATYLLREVCPKLLAGTGVTATKVVLWESEESFAEASLAHASLSSGTCGMTGAAAGLD
jgi:6-pyruvoyltetrahydropterin/6-carboxytetrahydropterin synthase